MVKIRVTGTAAATSGARATPNAPAPSTPASLEAHFLEEMERLRRRLTYRTGSLETSEDLLHDLWVRLRGRQGAPVRYPGSYVAQVADNLAVDELRRQRRRLPADEIAQLLDIPDEAPTPERTVNARTELQLVLAAMAELPPRRREIFVAARLRGERYASIAARHRVTTRTVENEVRRVLDHLAARLGTWDV